MIGELTGMRDDRDSGQRGELTGVGGDRDGREMRGGRVRAIRIHYILI